MTERKLFTKEEVDKADFIQTARLCMEHDIPCKNLVHVDDLKLKLLQYLQEKENPDGTCDLEMENDENIQDVIMNITGKDMEMREFLEGIYKSLKDFMLNAGFGESLEQELQISYGNFRKTIDDNCDELKRKDCPIVITGETSAGKSSLLNLLIGSEILTSTLLPSTSTICKLRHSSEKKVEVSFQNEEKKVIEITDENHLRQILEAYACVREASDKTYSQDTPECVDIFWSFPMLQEHVIIVDTPGIGDAEELTERVLEYMQEAVAYIYVINSGNAGGVQQDRIQRVLRTQHEWKKKGKLQTFDPRFALFVCNKWDQVPKHEEHKVWKDTLFKLSKSWPGFVNTQVTKLSVQKEKCRLDNSLPFTEEFKSFFKTVKTMIPHCLEGKLKRHVMWLLKFLRIVQVSMATKINASRKSAKEKQEYASGVESKLVSLESESNKIKKSLIRYLDEKENSILNDLFEFLNKEDTKKELASYRPEDCPFVPWYEPKMSLTKSIAFDIISERIQNKISVWVLENKDVKDLASDFPTMVKTACETLQKKENDIERQMCDINSSEINYNSFPIQLSMPYYHEAKNETPAIFYAGAGVELVAIGVGMAFVIPPILIGSLVFGLILLMGFGISRLTSYFRSDRKQYTDNKEKYMKLWTLGILKTLKKGILYDCLNEWYFQDVRNQIKKLCDEIIPNIIETDRKIMRNALDDHRREKSILDACLPLQQKVEQYQGKVLLFQLKELCHYFIPQDRMKQEDKIGDDGVSAKVFRAKYFLKGKWIPAAVKIFNDPLIETVSCSQLLEMDNLLKFEHHNVLELYGACLLERSGEEHLGLVTELCDMTLKGILHLCCCGMISQEEPLFKQAFKMYIDTSLQIVEGLEHIHSRGCVHRDLKLSNILVKDKTIKIADAGLLKKIKVTTGTFAGTPTYMAPEILKREYTEHVTAADIYSLGIILWEMWYNKTAFSESQYPGLESLIDLKNCLEREERPKIEQDMDKFPILRELIKTCWKTNPKLRPSAQKVKEKLQIVRDRHTGDGASP